MTQGAFLAFCWLIVGAAHADNRLPIAPPWLHDFLPDDTLVYARMPHPIGMLAAPKGNALDAALRNDANVEAVARIRDGISANVIPRIPAFQDLRLRMLERHLRGPVELAILSLPAPSLLISMPVDVRSEEDFQDLLAQSGGEEAGLSLAAPLDDRGVARLDGLPVPAYVQFVDGRLLLNIGPSLSAEAFDHVLAGIVENRDHAMRAMERRADASGQGVFFWVNIERALAMATVMMQPEQFKQITNAGLDKTSSVGFGWGVADGKGRISLLADLRPEYDRGLLPNVEIDLTARSAGEPDGLLLFAIPTAEEFARIEARIFDSLEADAIAEWEDTKLNMREEFGFSFDELLRSVGPELLFIFDDAGDYGAWKIRDRKLWERIISGVADAVESRPQRKRIGGKTYYHWALQGELIDLEDAPVTDSHWFAELVARSRDHYFWTYEGDYLYFSSVPQILMDRHELNADTDIAEWLRTRQRIDISTAFLSMSGTSSKLPERVYAVYLEILQVLADVAQTNIDIWSLPTARQLELQRAGTLGFTVSLGNPTLVAELTFENNPGEFLGGAGGLAIAGIVAAIAIPAYQDYTIRSNVSAGIALSDSTRVAVAGYYFETGEFPDQGRAAELSEYTGASEHVQSIIVEPGTGRIVIDFSVESIPDGGQIYLRPFEDEAGELQWECTGTFPQKRLPPHCEGGEANTRTGA